MESAASTSTSNVHSVILIVVFMNELLLFQSMKLRIGQRVFVPNIVELINVEAAVRCQLPAPHFSRGTREMRHPDRFLHQHQKIVRYTHAPETWPPAGAPCLVRLDQYGESRWQRVLVRLA